MTTGLYVHDGLRYIRIDRIEAIEETVTERKTDRYGADGGKVVEEPTRHVTTESGGQYSSPGTAADLLRDVLEVAAEYEEAMRRRFSGVRPVEMPGQ